MNCKFETLSTNLFSLTSFLKSEVFVWAIYLFKGFFQCRLSFRTQHECIFLHNCFLMVFQQLNIDSKPLTGRAGCFKLLLLKTHRWYAATLLPNILCSIQKSSQVKGENYTDITDIHNLFHIHIRNIFWLNSGGWAQPRGFGSLERVKYLKQTFFLFIY